MTPKPLRSDRPDRRAPALLAVGAVVVLLLAVLIVAALDRASARPPAPTGVVETPSSSAGAPLLAAEPVDSPSFAGAAVDIVLKLVAVLALLYLCLALLRRYGGGNGAGKRDGLLQVLDSVTLGPNRGIYFVRVMDKRLVIGVTASQIVTLAAWDLGGKLPETSSLPADFEGTLAALASRQRQP